MSSHEIAQRSDAWFTIRCGRVTASRIADVVAKTKSGWGASRKNYRAELVAERLTGEPAKRFVNEAMQWGTEKEPEAIASYEFLTDLEVQAVGFVEHPTIPMTGGSPDGLIGADGMIEVKAPNTSTHIETLLGKPIENKYVLQMQWNLACADRQWCDYVSYDPRLPASMQLFRKTIPRDEPLITTLQDDVRTFLAELDDMVAALQARYEKRAA